VQWWVVALLVVGVAPLGGPPRPQKPEARSQKRLARRRFRFRPWPQTSTPVVGLFLAAPRTRTRGGPLNC
jgi:hypothetical protein